MNLKPLHTACIDGRQIRFFRAPIEEPDLPMVPTDDLRALSGFPERMFQDSYLRPRQTHLREMLTAGGSPVQVAPHWIAKDLILRGVRAGLCDSGAYDEFKTEASIALQKLMVEIPAAQRVAFAATLARRTREREEA